MAVLVEGGEAEVGILDRAAVGLDDLELRKLYQILPDESAARSGFLRVIDDSGEDYLYPAGNFLRSGSTAPAPEGR